MKQLDLYIDESGTYYIGEPRYRFFSLAAVIMTPSEHVLADLLMKKWREKYLVNPEVTFHSADFFENFNNNKRQELKMKRNFDHACDELLEVFKHVKFSARVFYADIPELRRRLQIPEPPTKSTNPAQIQDYRNQKNQNRQMIRSSYGEKVIMPLTLVTHKIFDFHKMNLYQNPKEHMCGYIHFESQKDSDPHMIGAFHKYANLQEGNKYKYGKTFLGLNFHTKASLDVGVELADLIAYIACQTLRIRHKRTQEMMNITPKILNSIRAIRKELRLSFDIKHCFVTYE